MSQKLDQIRSLLATAEKHPDTPEGQSARRIARKKLEKLGMSEEDVALEKATILDKQRKAWEAALLHIVCSMYEIELRRHNDTDQDIDDLRVHGASNTVEQVSRRFNSLHTSVRVESDRYERAVKWIATPASIAGIMDTFCNFAVIALSERFLVESEEEEELDQIEDQSLQAPESNEEGDQAEDPMDKLLSEVENLPEHPSLDPALAGYQAGLRIETADPKTEEAIEVAKRIVARMGLLTEDETLQFDIPESPEETHR